MDRYLRGLALAAALGIAAGPFFMAESAEPTRVLDARRGGLLYDTVCGACHTTQAHWREKPVVRSWPDLLFQVERWQRVAGQGWSRVEIEDVAAYLNQHFYRLPCPTAGCTGSSD